MQQTKTEAPIARLMTSIHTGVTFTIETTPNGHIRVSTTAKYCDLSLDEAKNVLSPASDRRPARPLQSTAIDDFEQQLRTQVRGLTTR